MVLVEVNSHVVQTAGFTATMGMLAVFADAAVTAHDRATLLPDLAQLARHPSRLLVPQQQQQQHQHRSRINTTDDESKSKTMNTSTNVNKANTSKVGNSSHIQRQNTLTEPKSPNFSTKQPRQRSCDRKDMPMLPYQGVKFIPKQSHKYTAAEPFSNLEERTKHLGVKKEAKKLQEIETNKPLVALHDKKPIIVTQSITQHTRLNSSLSKHSTINNTNNKENSICSTTIETTNIEVKTTMNVTTGNCANDSVLSNKAGNLSTLSNSSRKLKPVQLHTETRAQKRHQYDQYLKDKERMAELIKKNLEMQKLMENKVEIQKLRAQCLFKSKPFKQVKPMEVKPSDKPLTEPKSPHLGLFAATTSTSKLNLTSNSNKTTTRSLSQDNLRIN